MFIIKECDGCHVKGVMYGSYFCNEAYCDCRLHKDCAESPLEINHHHSHPEHPLLLTKMSLEEYGTPCDFCGQQILSTYYTCPTCEFKVDLICGTKPSSSVIEHPVCHDHALMFLKKRRMKEKVPCELCKEYIFGPSYSCLKCNNVYFHLDCVHLSKEVNHSCHSSHPLKMMPPESLIDDDDDDDDDKVIFPQRSCHFCLDKPDEVLYHCSICNFTLCLGCTKRPPPLVVDDAKTHTHPLTLFSSNIIFICNVSGIIVRSYPSYICIKCDFIVSGYCIGLPRVININRHDHRITFTHHLARKGANCGVCRKRVSQYYGAYSCSICPDYVIHTRCAVDLERWNGLELEGIPETSCEDTVPFEVMGDNLIRHFSHEKHILQLLKYYDMVGDDYYERVRCEACVSQIWFGPFYSCQECSFVLHEKCAYLPMKKNLVFGSTSYELEYHSQGKVIYCKLCDVFCGGFKYRSQGIRLEYPIVDVHCSSISEPFVHNGHLHPLYFVKMKKERCCSACRRDLDSYLLTCSACGFDLCLYCATLPEKIWHISDEHPLTLYYSGKEATGKNWCEVCEMELLDSSKWFFTCSDCGVTIHVQCVLGDFSRFPPNCSISFWGKDYFVILNNQNSRPFCTHCHHRCKASVILQYKGNDEHNEYFCSISCLPRNFMFFDLKSRFFPRFGKGRYRLKKGIHLWSTLPPLRSSQREVIIELLEHVWERYEPQGPDNVHVDVHCSFISESFVHNGHLHPLYFVITKKERRCNACRRIPDGYYMLTCSDCDFDLCLYCSTLPEKIWHISDEHPLTLYYGGKEATGKNWCEVCEMELDPSKWFFTCSDCGVTFHVGCVLGDFSRLTPNCSIHRGGKEHLAILNHQSSRPFCRHCHDRCKAPVILQVNDEHNGYICSRSCLVRSC
ncbi:hypothetical protein Bca4012_069270 [Brassica carinata]